MNPAEDIRVELHKAAFGPLHDRSTVLLCAAVDEIERLRRDARRTEQQMAILHAEKDMEIQQLRDAATKTIEENLNLADGEDCTLRHLKAALSAGQGEKT